MTGSERRAKIIDIIRNSETPVPGRQLASVCGSEQTGDRSGHGADPHFRHADSVYEPRICDERAGRGFQSI